MITPLSPLLGHEQHPLTDYVCSLFGGYLDYLNVNHALILLSFNLSNYIIVNI